jgi:hypothetical protein
MEKQARHAAPTFPFYHHGWKNLKVYHKFGLKLMYLIFVKNLALKLIISEIVTRFGKVLQHWFLPSSRLERQARHAAPTFPPYRHGQNKI